MIDEQLFKEAAEEVESEYGMGGLSDGLYFDFALDTAKKYIEKVQGGDSEELTMAELAEVVGNVIQNGIQREMEMDEMDEEGHEIDTTDPGYIIGIGRAKQLIENYFHRFAALCKATAKTQDPEINEDYSFAAGTLIERILADHIDEFIEKKKGRK